MHCIRESAVQYIYIYIYIYIYTPREDTVGVHHRPSSPCTLRKHHPYPSHLRFRANLGTKVPVESRWGGSFQRQVRACVRARACMYARVRASEPLE